MTNTVAEKIKRLRKSKGLSQDAVAEKLHISQSAYARIENGERNSKKIIEIITNILNEEPLSKIDYVEVVDNLTIENIENIDRTALIAMAVYIGKTRLIDNFIYEI